ncbi:MAG TPA: hypothetical protein PLL06_14125, partial [Acidobacteriota bacterium]|nr:hypothetical protein [Acidobacteriota bacterium]
KVAPVSDGQKTVWMRRQLAKLDTLIALIFFIIAAPSLVFTAFSVPYRKLPGILTTENTENTEKNQARTKPNLSGN